MTESYTPGDCVIINKIGHFNIKRKTKFKPIDIELDDNKVGNSEYHPRLMLKLLIYGCSYGVKSSRKLTPGHKTIAEFRRHNKRTLKKVLKLCARLCIKLDLIGGNVLFLDGTKIRANASRRRNHTHKWHKEQLRELDERIDRLLEGCETIDEKEADMGSLVKMREDLANTAKLKETVEQTLEGFKERGTKTKNRKERTINMTDTESTLMKSVQGSHASYNVQNAVDDKNGLIVHSDKECDTACADTGYAVIEDLTKISQRGSYSTIQASSIAQKRGKPVQ